MKITIEHVGFLKIDGVKPGAVVEFPEGTTVAEVLDHFELKAGWRKYIIPIVNGERSSQERVLADGDRLFIFLPVGGG